MKRILSTAGILLLLLFLLRYPQEALSASRDGLGLWLNTLIPTLLPFLILTGFLIRTGTADKLTSPARSFWKICIGITPFGAYALILGLLCGYPMGAKITSDMYRHGKIGKREAEYLLTFTNHASPVFISTYLVHICLKDQTDREIVYLILFLSAFLTMLFFRFIIFKNHTVEEKTGLNPKMEPSKACSLGTLLDTSIMNGFETIARLAVIFSCSPFCLLSSGITGNPAPLRSACFSEAWNLPQGFIFSLRPLCLSASLTSSQWQ